MVGNGLISSPMLCFFNMGVNCSLFAEKHMPIQEIIELQTCRTLRWNGKNDAIINFIK